MTDDVWGPWIEHDGKGCPIKGAYAQWYWHNGILREGFAGCSNVNFRTGQVLGPAKRLGKLTWDWSSGAPHRVVRYRIRKPHGLTILQQCLEDLRQEVQA